VLPPQSGPVPTRLNVTRVTSGDNGTGRRPFTIHKLRTMRDGDVTRVGRGL